MIGDINKKKDAVSLYQPSQDVSDLLARFKEDYTKGYNILHRNWRELNDMSVISRMNWDQETFNSYVPPASLDPDEQWKWRGTRSMARNKMMVTYSHLTSKFEVPTVNAQNLQDEEDKQMAEVMRDSMKWTIDNSNYKSSFLLAAMGALVNPVTFLEADYMEVYQTIKERDEMTGKVTTCEILDEVFSGFNANVLSADQVLIMNAHQQNIQRQKGIFKREWLSWHEAEAKYKEFENWAFVEPGKKVVFNEDDGLFYQIHDVANDGLVEVVTAKYRTEDMEIPIVTGIPMYHGDINEQPMRHRDNRGAPKYNCIPFGYERINEHFFYYKSLINKVGWDHLLIDRMYENGMNAAIMEMFPHTVVTGEEEVDISFSFPAGVTAFANADTKVSPVHIASSAPAFNAINAAEQSMAESSSSDVQSGEAPGDKTAYAVARAEQNAQINLSTAGKSIAESVSQFGQLMIDIIVSQYSIPQIEELANGQQKLKYRTLLLQDAVVDGKKVSKKIRFSDALIGRSMTDEQKRYAQYDMLDKVGGPDSKQELIDVNPFLFSKMKYLCISSSEEFMPDNKALEDAKKQDMYSSSMANPNIIAELDTKTFTHDFWLATVVEGDEDKYLRKVSSVMGAPGGMPPPTEGMPTPMQGALGAARSPAGPAGLPQ